MASYHLTVKIGKRGTGGSHADYVQRAGAYKNYQGGEDLVHAEAANMPRWAEHSPSEFFRQADLHERKNGSVYREFEIAIPKELTPKQRIEFVRELVRQEIGNKHPIIWALHNPTAAISGGRQPHAHIMYSERALDGIERDPEQFFKRYNSKEPKKGGCQKSNVFSGGLKSEERRTAIVGLRERFADMQNEHLKKYGHDVRVSHLSLAAQGIKRAPEKHLGPVASRICENVALLQEHRNASFLFELHQQHASIIDTTSSLAAALRERKENERNRAAAYERIGTSLTTADRAFSGAIENYRGIERVSERVAEAARGQHARRAEEFARAFGRELGRALPEVARAAERLAAISKERDLATLLFELQKVVAELPARCMEDERKGLEVKYAAQGVVRKLDHSRNAESVGYIVEATDRHIVISLGRDHYAIHDIVEFQCVEYDGSAIGENRFAKGNRATFNYREKPEQRKAIINELRPEKIIKQNGRNYDTER